MSYRSDETVYLSRPNGEGELELDLEVVWQRAEPDIGISQDFVDYFTINAINGKRNHAKLVDRIIYNSKSLNDDVLTAIYNAQ